MTETYLFWLVAAAMALGAAALMARPILLNRADPARDADLAVYRDQLAEIDRDLARGVLAGDEGQRLRAEAARRLLEADRARGASAGAGRLSRWPVLVILVLGALGSLALYRDLGAPGYPDLPLDRRIAASEELRQTRPSQAQAVAAAPAPAPVQADADFLALMDKLRAAMQDRPDDAAGLELLARNEAALGNYAAAETAQRSLIRVRGEATTSADHATLAEIMILQAGGYVSPEAEAELVEALKRDPTNGAARFYSGVMFAQIGRPDQTFRLWRPLLEDGPQDAPYLEVVRAEIPGIAEMAGVRYSPPEALPGPDAETMAAAADMSPEERQQIIRGMVDQLSERLSTEGGTPQEWARLISSLAVLGELDRADAIWTEAQTVFSGTPDGLAEVRAAAEQAGLIP